MNKEFDIVALGELLIDFTPSYSTTGVTTFTQNAGGAPANVLTAVAQLGGKTSFIGKVGYDMFGEFLAQTLAECGIDTRGLCYDREVNTTLAFVKLAENGERSFSFYRNPGADIRLTESDVAGSILERAKIFHFGSLSLTAEPARGATRYALDTAKAAGALISFDPNLRPALWTSLEEAKKQITEHLPYADILKVSEEEFSFITGSGDYASLAPDFCQKYGIKILFVTLGAKGAYYYSAADSGIVPAKEVKAVDTTGCGDAFVGAVLYQIANSTQSLDNLNLRAITTFANLIASRTALFSGAIPAIKESINGI